MEKEGRQKRKGEQEKDLSISGMVLAAKEIRPWVGQQVTWGRKTSLGRVWVPFPAPSNLCVLWKIPG